MDGKEKILKHFTLFVKLEFVEESLKGTAVIIDNIFVRCCLYYKKPAFILWNL